MKKNLTIRQRIMAGFIAVFCVVVLTGIITWVMWLGVYEKINTELLKSDSAQDAVEEISVLLFKKNRYVEELSSGFESLSKISEEYELVSSEIGENIIDLEKTANKSFVVDSELSQVKNNIDELSGLHQEIFTLKTLEQTTGSSVSAEVSKKKLLDLLRQNDSLLSQTVASVEKLHGSITEYRNQTIEQSVRLIQLIFVSVLIALVLFIGASVLATQYVSNYILNAVNKFVSISELVAAGNLETLIDIETNDEFGRLGKYFNEMINKIKTSFDQISVSKAETEKRNAEIEKKNKQLEEGDRAMLNILEDSKHLQEQLQQEKANVEEKIKQRTADLQTARDEVSKGWIQIQREKDRLTSSLNSLSVGFVLTDTENNVVVANPAISGILGISNPNFTFHEVVEKFKSGLNLLDIYETSISTGKPVSVKEVPFGNKFLSVFVAPIFSTSKETIGVVVMIEDITNEKIIERSRDEFFSIASHELRTPLTAIRGNTDLITQYYGEKVNSDPDLKEMIQDIHESSVRLINIVNDFLDTSRLEMGKVDFKKDRLKMKEIIESTIKEYQLAGALNNIHLELSVTGDKPFVAIGDKDKVKQVLINLVGNALKFTSQGQVMINLDQNDSDVVVSVTDTGRGISRENQNLLFKKFQQASSSLFTRDTTKGTGLGLYISKLLMDGMGGSIGLVKTEEGKGSTFYFSLPIDKG